MSNKYSESLLSLDEDSFSFTQVGMILFELKYPAPNTSSNPHPEWNHFSEAMSYSEYRYPDYVETYIYLLAAMSDEDIETYKDSFNSKGACDA